MSDAATGTIELQLKVSNADQAVSALHSFKGATEEAEKGGSKLREEMHATHASLGVVARGFGELSPMLGAFAEKIAGGTREISMLNETMGPSAALLGGLGIAAGVVTMAFAAAAEQTKKLKEEAEAAIPSFQRLASEMQHTAQVAAEGRRLMQGRGSATDQAALTENAHQRIEQINLALSARNARHPEDITADQQRAINSIRLSGTIVNSADANTFFGQMTPLNPAEAQQLTEQRDRLEQDASRDADLQARQAETQRQGPQAAIPGLGNAPWDVSGTHVPEGIALVGNPNAPHRGARAAASRAAAEALRNRQYQSDKSTALYNIQRERDAQMTLDARKGSANEQRLEAADYAEAQTKAGTTESSIAGKRTAHDAQLRDIDERQSKIREMGNVAREVGDQVGEAFDKIVSGHENAGKVIQQLFHAEFAMHAKKNLALGIEDTAMGIAASFWNPDAAADYFAAAGLHFTAAAAFGVGAGVTSGGGGGAGGSRGGGASRPENRSFGGGGGGPQSVTIVLPSNGLVLASTEGELGNILKRALSVADLRG